MKRSIFVFAAIVCCVITAFAEVKEPDNYTYRRGVEAIQDGDSEKGIELLNREIQDNPKNGYAYMWIAAARGGRAEYGKAITAVNYALKYLPKKDKENLAWAYKIRAIVNLNLEDTTAAINDYTMAIKTDPSVYDYYEQRADTYYEIKEYEKSIADYLQMIKMEPGNTDGYMGYGRTLRDQNKLDEAIEQFSYTIKLDSKFSQSLAFRAECYLKQKKYEEAVADLIQAIQMDDKRKAA